MWRDGIVDFARQLDHPAWGIAHAERTYHTTLALGAADRVEVREPVAFAVAYLHDLGAFPRFAREGTPAYDVSADTAAELLADLSYPEEWRDDVVAIIRAHDFVRPPLALPESRCFHDADMLDFMGAVGITRLLAISGIEDWIAGPRQAVDTARAFADTLPDKLVTAAGRALAVERQLETRTWLAWLEGETAELAEL